MGSWWWATFQMIGVAGDQFKAKVVMRLPSFLCGLFAYRYDLIADRRTADSKQFGGLAVPIPGAVPP